MTWPTRTSAERWSPQTPERLGRLDILVNNAGVSGGTQELMKRCEFEAWRRLLLVNLDGVFLGLRFAGPAIAKAGGGSIVNISSILGKVGMAGAAAYCASKGGVALLTKAAGLEWAVSLGIRVNSVHPGFIDTERKASSVLAADGERQRDAGYDHLAPCPGPAGRPP